MSIVPITETIDPTTGKAGPLTDEDRRESAASPAL
jgi:hypothetical protein